MSPAEVLVPLTFFICFALIIGFSISKRHRERMAMIEHGVPADMLKTKGRPSWFVTSPLSSLKWGIIITAIGLAILIGNFLRDVYNVDKDVTAGLIFLLAGLGLVVFYAIAAKKERESEPKS